MSGNLILIVLGGLSTIISVSVIVLKRIRDIKLENKVSRSEEIYEMHNAMDLALRQNLHEAGLTLSSVGLTIPENDKISEFVLPEIFWETKGHYMARTLITLVNLYIVEYGTEITVANRDTMAVLIYRELAKQIKQFAKKDTNKALSLVVELATRDKRAAKGLNYCFLGKYAEDIFD